MIKLMSKVHNYKKSRKLRNFMILSCFSVIFAFFISLIFDATFISYQMAKEYIGISKLRLILNALIKLLNFTTSTHFTKY